MVSCNWPGGDGMRHFQILPVKQITLPASTKYLSLWVKGPGDNRYIAIHLIDANGKTLKLGLKPRSFRDWKKFKLPIPQSNKGPFKIKSIVWHDWNIKGPPVSSVYLLTDLKAVGGNTP